MKILHSGSLKVKSGGPALSMWLTVKGLKQYGVDVISLTEPLSSDDKLISPDSLPVFTDNPKFSSLAYIPHLTSVLSEISDIDLYHIQGIWMLHGTQIARYARKYKIPYVVALRGMLYPQALAHNSCVKKLSLALYQAKTLRQAAAIQATCIEEMKHYRALGFKNPVAVIPNPIEVDKYVNRPLQIKTKFRIGYLGRVHPRKRIELLIYALANLRTKLPTDTELIIIGGGDENYEKFLHSEADRLDLNTQVKFAGFLSGKEKDDAIDSISVLAVPSDFENFGNIVTEALVHGVPVIASKGMPWQELPENGCGWWIDNSQDTIDKTILEAYNLGAEKLYEMGIRGRELMLRNYSVEALGLKMKTLYEWILNGGNKPNFVFTVDGK